MSKVITFSRVFPSYHPRKGQPTYFVEKLWRSLGVNENNLYKFLPFIEAYNEITSDDISNLVKYEDLQSKHHTIRAINPKSKKPRIWKAGDWFTPKVWGDDINPKSGRKGPYHSKQIQFAPDIQIKKVWDIDIEGSDWFVNGKRETPIIGSGFNSELLAANDGLSGDDLFHWFVDSPDFKKNKAFSGQIICWNENIEY
jgi:hypothetical protein